MSKFDASNFLSKIKNLVTGGGLMKDGVSPQQDAGFLIDKAVMGDASVPSGTTYIIDGSSFPVYNIAASNVTGPTAPFQVPRDYDEQTDEIHIKFVALMGGATDTPTVTVTPKKRVLGSAAAAFSPSTQVTAALSTVQTQFDLVWRGQGLQRDNLVEFTFSSGLHTTDALQIAALQITYRSTLVSYHESDGNPRDGKNGNFLR